MGKVDAPTRDAILAEPAGGRLDKWVAELIFGWTEVDRDGREGWPPGSPPPEARTPAMRMTWVPDYSTDIGEAWGVVERLRAEHYEPVIDGGEPHDPWHVQCDPAAHVYADTAPLAICRCALLCVLSEAARG